MSQNTIDYCQYICYNYNKMGIDYSMSMTLLYNYIPDMSSITR